jgi:7-carboxy-7-deazaguanine synthase (Cx14CxxC type)
VQHAGCVGPPVPEALMAYAVKEMFLTLQGEGAQSGRAAVFCRFAGCNLWSGREQDRATARCSFCDTDFVGIDGDGGGRFAAATRLAEAIDGLWVADRSRRFVVLTGGEPTLQVDVPLLDALHDLDYEVAIETNGTRAVPAGVDWICVSPKAGTQLEQISGDELKLVFPQSDLDPSRFERLDFEHFFVQPCDGPSVAENTSAAIAFCLAHPRWRLSTQTHKTLGIR